MRPWVKNYGTFGQAIRDKDGEVDVSYLALFWVMIAVLGTIFFICGMSAWSFLRCSGQCVFDPGPIGSSVGMICAGFATSLAALAAYMTANRPARKDKNGESNQSP